MECLNVVLFTLVISIVTGSALYESCDSDDNCGTLDTYCKNGTCLCKEDFAVLYDHCVQLANPYIPCTHKSNCRVTLGQKGICPHKQCACRSFHHLHNSQCVKSKGLDEECDHHHQCYCGKDCNDKIECANRVCTCKPGYKKYSRRCIPDIVVLSSPSTNMSNSGNLTPVYFMFITFLIRIL